MSQSLLVRGGERAERTLMIGDAVSVLCSTLISDAMSRRPIAEDRRELGLWKLLQAVPIPGIRSSPLLETL